MAKTKIGRPPTSVKKFKQPGRVDLRLEESTKQAAIAALPALGYADLSAFMRHILDLLAAGQLATIPAIANPNQREIL